MFLPGSPRGRPYSHMSQRYLVQTERWPRCTNVETSGRSSYEFSEGWQLCHFRFSTRIRCSRWPATSCLQMIQRSPKGGRRRTLYGGCSCRSTWPLQNSSTRRQRVRLQLEDATDIIAVAILTVRSLLSNRCSCTHRCDTRLQYPSSASLSTFVLPTAMRIYPGRNDRRLKRPED